MLHLYFCCAALLFQEVRLLVKSLFLKLIKTADFYITIFLYILSVFVYSMARNFPIMRGAPRAQNPGFYPILLSVMLFILTTILLINTIRKVINNSDDLVKIENKKAEDNLEKGKSEKLFWGKSTPLTKKYLALAVIMTYIYIHLLNWLGFVISTFVFMIVMSRAISPKEKFKTSKLTIISIIVTVIFYIIFDMIIGIRFPSGVLF